MPILSDIKSVGTAQVLVTLKGVSPGDEAALTATKPSAMQRLKSHFTVREHSLVAMVAAAARSTPVVKARTVAPRPPAVRVYEHLGLMLGTVDEGGYAGLRRDPAVASVDRAPAMSLIWPTASKASAAAAGLTWGLQRLRVKELWDEGITGRGVIVGHLDTGVDGSHPALKGAISAFAEFDWNGDEIPGAKPRDSDEHGTHTAGTIVGRAVGSMRFGVAPGAQLVSALVIEGGNVVARILGGMNWIVGQGARILSMSLGLRGYREDFLPLMQAIRSRGILPVIAIGNEGAGTSRSPGNYDLVLSVGASDEKDRVATFSSSQWINRPVDPIVPDLVGPGTDVLSALPGNGYGRMDGTSMATPHIAGLAALLWQRKPNATVEEIEAAICASCKRPAAMPAERGNRGIPDAVVALQKLMLGAAAIAVAPKGAKKRKKKTKRSKKGKTAAAAKRAKRAKN